METKYNVLKAFDGFEEGSVLDLSATDKTFTNDDIAKLIADGVIEPVYDESEFQDFVVTQEFLDENPEVATAGIKVGDTVQVPKEEPEEEKPPVAADETVVAAPVKIYMQKKVIAETTRIVNGKIYTHIKLEDGTTHDLTNEEYQEAVTTLK